MDFTAERMAQARRCTRAALDNWDAGDLARVEFCQGLLEESVMDLRAIEDRLRSERAAAPGGLSSGLLGLKQEITQMARVVDAGLAFHRGVALRMGCSAPAYGPQGQFAEDLTHPGRRGMQG